MLKAIVFVFCLLCITINSYANEPVIDVRQVAGKSKSSVEAILGTPKKCEPSKYGEKCTYNKGETEIIFIKQKADWITIEALDTFDFDSNTLSVIGLPIIKPSTKTDHVLRWNSFKGLLEVSLFKAGNKSDYMYIKVSTR